ncbi:hypothetical protein GCM10011348_12950 [Marinobacterium nitratireducens]|uniref:DUF306 domain-containing protein n=1 Tax=Marinobacterium nitratireducens TaxID=518897 RepID=A0A918DRD4_9GAMM|nr:META domain-containing protein [Marinobacterium nitratireducens]GGO79218.1 hypothetical protein GCM10011348_12950 [Marinobacterium nitratireducens]
MYRTLSLAAMIALSAGCASQGGHTTMGTTKDPDAVKGVTWQWLSKTTDKERLEVTEPERYTFALQPDGRVYARFDCNQGNGAYEISSGKLEFGPIAMTRKACLPGSLDSTYAQALVKVESFRVEDGELILGLDDDGSMHFRAAP